MMGEQGVGYIVVIGARGSDSPGHGVKYAEDDVEQVSRVGIEGVGFTRIDSKHERTSLASVDRL